MNMLKLIRSFASVQSKCKFEAVLLASRRSEMPLYPLDGKFVEIFARFVFKISRILPVFFIFLLLIYLPFYFSSFSFLTKIRQDLQPEWNGKIFNCARVSLTREILRFNGQIPERNSA